jgi:hypothetical protein
LSFPGFSEPPTSSGYGIVAFAGEFVTIHVGDAY